MYRLFILLFTLTILSSCILHTQFIAEIDKQGMIDNLYAIGPDGRLAKCEPWIQPSLPVPPPVPRIPQRYLGNPNEEQRILVESIRSHREYIKRVNDIIDASHNDYMKKCTRQK